MSLKLMELREPRLEASEPRLEARDPRLLLDDTVRELADRLERKMRKMYAGRQDRTLLGLLQRTAKIILAEFVLRSKVQGR